MAQQMDPNEAMEPAGPEVGEASEAQDDGSYTICIHVAADGALSVGLEQEAADPADEYAGLKPAEDIKDALTQALAIYKQDGKATAESQFDAGFTGKLTQ
jgi:hypothetical protein